MNFIVCLLYFFVCGYLGAFTDTKTHFSFTNDPIDVVIPSVEKDLVTLKLCIEGIKKNGANIRRVIVVSRRRLTTHAEWFKEKLYPFTYQDVAIALANGNPETEQMLLQRGSRTGWYYQQLLKLYAPLVIPGISSNVLILDSDTIFLNPTNFLNSENAGLYNPAIEYHPPYFRHAARLIPGFYKLFIDDSGISHHMIFQRPVIEDLFKQVESIHHEPFWKVFCKLVAPEDIIYSGASEYEIYFNYVFSRTNQTAIRKLLWRNIQRFKDIEVAKREGLNYVSIHSFDRVEE